MATASATGGPRCALGDVVTAQTPVWTTAADAAVVRLFGGNALVFYSLDPTEHTRRTAACAKPLTRLRDMETLLKFPVGMPVPLRSLERPTAAAVRALPGGAADIRHGQVMRHAIRPVHVDLVVVTADNPRRGLAAAGRFAPFARRAVMLDRPGAATDMLLLEAAFYGIGVIARQDDGLRVLVQPEPFQAVRHSAAGWLFVEDIYSLVTGAAVTVPGR